MDAARTRDTQLLFVTTGILLRYLAGNALLSAFSHVIVDEVRHRRPCYNYAWRSYVVRQPDS